ncbi:Na/Pi cotransporter family protein [Aquicoccus porphyridii]|uniref:Na/Pi cotransporter family protein n=1 Tax=Aquicoccus porphyridii TaxID=1852029 RepID=A0A5A9YZ19_9RHOB|nr:Na/Pi symporter [Aquicoccus porphyridii]KAA0910098.1 Na/Pi cotransporter family protein [Aquicoccus porphyridii]RAI53454.1 Na/Pi cotransporter family protein [Rhodobacteraceae bacterium AsT-22]
MGDTGGILTALGGVGLFLLGMTMLTEGLQGLAGQSLRRLLRRFTRTPLRGVAAGAVVTAALQSSSAVTVMVIGFVGAGLLTFAQGLGVVFGANIGTTFTGWLVALLGFRVDLGALALPLVFAGGLIRLLGGVRGRHVGGALAGFALLFLGLGLLQAGMAGLSEVITPERFPGDTALGRAQLVLIGAVVTVVTQSSSAGVATALVALDAGAIGFGQAAVMVIGMNIGTTFTALLATLGGTVAARQTGLAHLLFNLLTGGLAFVLLIPFAPLAETWIAEGGRDAARLSLVIFHTVFNVVGVGVILIALGPFMALVRTLLRERREALTARLDARLLVQPGAAVDAAGATVSDIARHMQGLLIARLSPSGPAQGDNTRLRQAMRALEETRGFVGKIDSAGLSRPVRARYAEILHILDHLTRLAYRIAQEERVATLHRAPRLARLARITRTGLIRGLSGDGAGQAEWFGRWQAIVQARERRLRDALLAQAGQGADTPGAALAQMDAARWLYRVNYHVWRIWLHLDRIEQSREGREEIMPSPARDEARADVRAD